jgi:GNAT superfamily N-acetyltransferase
LSQATFSVRLAHPDDAAAIGRLIAASARHLCAGDYTPVQVEAALRGAWGLDSQLILDRTYFVAESGDDVVGCGGWSRRRTLFGSDHASGRSAELLDPQRESARIRAFFVAPEWARRGIGRALLDRCEREARAAGFSSLELGATLPGARLYRAHGYVAGEPYPYEMDGGVLIEITPMRKVLD